MKSKLVALTVALTVSTAPAVGAEMTEAERVKEFDIDIFFY